MEYHTPAPATSTRSTSRWPSRRKCPGGIQSARLAEEAAAMALEKASRESDSPRRSAPKSTTDNECGGVLRGAGTREKPTRHSAPPATFQSRRGINLTPETVRLTRPRSALARSEKKARVP